MPNWCDNRITIHGPKKYIRKIDKIVNENANGKGLLDYMMPMPKELEDTTSPSSSSDRSKEEVNDLRLMILFFSRSSSNAMLSPIEKSRISSVEDNSKEFIFEIIV